ncbi:MAG: ABC transporter ATP-binding protein [Tissierellia bacterium]|nr:ABC transporter ATP-binding protein [Tissierellia bacterium]
MELNIKPETVKKKKDYRKIFRGLLKYVYNEWKMMLVAFILIMVSNILSLQGPKFSGEAIDAMGADTGIVNIPLATQNAIKMFLVYLISGILGYIMTRLMARIAQRVIVAMRQDTFDKIVDLPLSYIDTHQAGDLVSRISYDLDLVNQSITHDILTVAASLITVVGSLSMMISISPKLSLMFLMLIPFTVLFTIYRIKKTRPLFSKRSKKLGEMNGYVEEILFGQKTIQSYEKEEFFSQQFNDRNEESVDAYYKADYQAAINGPSVTLITNISLALVTMFGAILFLNGEFSIGFLSSFILYSRRFSGPINEIAAIVADLQSALSALDRVFDLHDQPSEPEDKKNAKVLKEVQGDVIFDRVSFGYSDDQIIIEDMSFHVKPGNLTAIVGPTGAGKTTIINLLMRFYDPQKGSIYIDGNKATDVTRASLRQSFAMVLQDAWLFKGTIRDNIAYGKEDASLDDIKRVAKACHIDHFIESQPLGYDSIIDDGADNISQGQKQLLTIARAMLLDAPILILDEATSNVDSRTEIQIQDSMNKLIEGRTSFVIAHRLSTIQNADNIILIKDGRIAESGTHTELLEENGDYANLFNAQFS